jgi:hypothetical protein
MLCEMFYNTLSFFSEELLALCLTSELEDHPLLAKQYICRYPPHLGSHLVHPQSDKMPFHGDNDPPILSGSILLIFFKKLVSVFSLKFYRSQ